MTRKDYELLKQSMLTCKPAKHWDKNKITQYCLCVRSLAKSLAENNRHFSAERFRLDCGIQYDQQNGWTVIN